MEPKILPPGSGQAINVLEQAELTQPAHQLATTKPPAAQEQLAESAADPLAAEMQVRPAQSGDFGQSPPRTILREASTATPDR